MKFRLSLVLLLSFFQFACEKTETEVSVEIQVKTNKGEVVDGADVLISDILAGTTNAEGKLELTKKFAPGSRQKIEIYKNSDQFYYARYVDSFQVAEKVAQKLNIMATLYYAPKPTDADETSLSEAETPEIMTDPLETAKKEIAAAEVFRGQRVGHGNGFLHGRDDARLGCRHALHRAEDLAELTLGAELGPVSVDHVHEQARGA